MAGRTIKDIESEIKALEKKQFTIDKKMKANETKLRECGKLQQTQWDLSREWHNLRQQIDARREIASGYDARLRRELKKM
jgi:hypothetical protein